MGRVARLGKRRHSTTCARLWLQASGVLALEETQPRGLANDGGLGGLIVIETRVAGGWVIAAGDASGADAPIRIRGEDTTGLIHSRVIEVQEVSGPVGAGGALGT